LKRYHCDLGPGMHCQGCSLLGTCEYTSPIDVPETKLYTNSITISLADYQMFKEICQAAHEVLESYIELSVEGLLCCGCNSQKTKTKEDCKQCGIRTCEKEARQVISKIKAVMAE
jgi:hypothetical protein